MICDLFLYLLHFKHFIFLACTMVVADTGSLAFLLSIMFLSWWNARLFFWSFLSGMHLPRVLDNARSIFHMGFWKKSHCQFSSRNLLEQDEVWGSRKTEERREGLYESSRAVTLVDGLPRAPSLSPDGTFPKIWSISQTLTPFNLLLQNFPGPLAFRITICMVLAPAGQLFIKIWPQGREIFKILCKNFWKKRMHFWSEFAPLLCQ